MTRWLWTLGAASLVFAARLREIHLHAGDVPFLDQWKAEGLEILLPWLQGSLSVADFFRPHHEHFPLWTRLLVWLETGLTGRWDPVVQMTVNAGLHAVYVGLVLHWLRTSQTWRTGLPAAVLALATCMLPFAWENITWGFQSQFPLALLFLFLHARGSLAHPPGSGPWWWAQAAAVAGLFTLGSMWTAPLVVVAVVWWSGAASRRHWLVPLALAGAGLGGMLWLIMCTPSELPVAWHAGSIQVFLQAWFVQLGWPTGTVLINVPLFVLALRLRGRKDAEPFDRIVLALGLWSVLQGAAVAYARGGGYVGFVSRYGDLLAVGLLANALALLRLLASVQRGRWLAAGLALVWSVPVVSGLKLISTRGHTEYFHERSAQRAVIRREAVQAFVQDGNRAHLAEETVRSLLYYDPDTLAELLSRPDFRNLLPAVSGPTTVGIIVRKLNDFWWLLAAAAIADLIAGVAGNWFPPLPALTARDNPWSLGLLGGLALASFAGFFLWPRPLLFGEFRRNNAIIRASGTITPLVYNSVESSAYETDQWNGAAQLNPENVRTLFRGTAVSGPADQAVIRSDPFILVTPRLIIPFAGNPQAPGVTLQVVVADKSGRAPRVYTCTESAPVAGVDFWEIDTTADQGRPARILLTDHSTAADGWIAAASPQYAWKPGQAALRRQAWAREQSASGHQALGLICLTSLLGLGWAGGGRRVSQGIFPD